MRARLAALLDGELEDANGRRYPMRRVLWKLGDTIVRSVGVALLLVAIGLAWEAFH